MKAFLVFLSGIATAIAFVWALPYTLIGLGLGSLGLLTHGNWQRHGIVFEFHGGFLRWMFDKLSGKTRFFVAMTLGFTIVGRDERALNASREHELVHVRQYALWGPLFLPAYFTCWLWLRVRGRDAYRENPFEKQAYAVADCSDYHSEPEA